MRKSTLHANTYAVSEVVGATLLVLIALASAVAIYSQMLPVPIPSPEPNIQLMGYVTEDGTVIIQHMGGELLDSYEVYTDGELVYTNSDGDYIDIGGTLPSSIAPTLLDENDQVRVTVYSINDDGSNFAVFDGILSGPEEKETIPQLPPPIFSMPISTLRTNSVDEDIICYSSFVTPNINPVLSYIFSWEADYGDGFTPITNLLLPFDTNNEIETQDYSGNNPNGTIYGAAWISDGLVGGAYSFDGGDYISLPYCFEEDLLEEFTVEAWVKTSEPSGTLLTYDRNNYWELAISGGMVKWTTNASDGVTDILGETDISDNQWHHIATTYNSVTGECSIYIDGLLDTTQTAHEPGETLGSGDTPIGFIGKGTGSAERETIFSTGFETQNEKNAWKQHNLTEEVEETWEILDYNDFNYGYGSYTDGGDDCYRTSEYKHEGSHCVRLRDDTSSSECTLSNAIDVDTPEYTSIKVDFWWMWNGYGWGNHYGEDWWVKYYDGSQWQTVLDMNYPSGYSKDIWFHQILYINETDYNFPSYMKIKFECDASYDTDMVYFDQIYINATGGDDRIEYDFDLLDGSCLLPKSGSYSIGGSGEVGIEDAAFNRSGIDISSYTDVHLSVWYSYEDTEETDFIGLYYKDNDDWIALFEDDNPHIVDGQSDWVYIESDIPETIDTLVLQFKWMTSSTTEYVAIDNLVITGVIPSGENNFTGIIDQVTIFKKELSAEQIHQNYLQSKDGESSQNVIVSEETSLGELWKCIVTPNNSLVNDMSTESDTLLVISYNGGQ